MLKEKVMTRTYVCGGDGGRAVGYSTKKGC